MCASVTKSLGIIFACSVVTDVQFVGESKINGWSSYCTVPHHIFQSGLSYAHHTRHKMFIFPENFVNGYY